MKIKDLYWSKFIDEIEKKGYEYTYNDDNGIYYIPELNIIIKKWNGKISIARSCNMDDKTLFKLIRFINESETYWFEIIEESREEHEQENEKN